MFEAGAPRRRSSMGAGWKQAADLPTFGRKDWGMGKCLSRPVEILALLDPQTSVHVMREASSVITATALHATDDTHLHTEGLEIYHVVSNLRIMDVFEDSAAMSC
eukprot:3625725-Pleurochrysis_carterae.AAC.1